MRMQQMPHRFHREMAKSPYFQMLTPYLQHLSEEQILALSVDYFRAHTSELDMAFRLFHAQCIAPALTSNTSSGELVDQLRRKQDPQDILDDWRRNRSTTSAQR